MRINRISKTDEQKMSVRYAKINEDHKGEI